MVVPSRPGTAHTLTQLLFLHALPSCPCEHSNNIAFDDCLLLFVQKMFDIKMAEFKFNLLCYWNQSGQFEELTVGTSTTSN